MEVLAPCEFFVQDGDALLVDFDGGEFHATVQQVLREGSMAGSDFKHGFAFVCWQITCDSDCSFYIQKVLTKFTTTCSIHVCKCRIKS